MHTWPPFWYSPNGQIQKNVVLVGDLVDGLYDPRQFPYVTHEEGVKLLVKHVEKYWCPSAEIAEINEVPNVRRSTIAMKRD